MRKQKKRNRNRLPRRLEPFCWKHFLYVYVHILMNESYYDIIQVVSIQVIYIYPLKMRDGRTSEWLMYNIHVQQSQHLADFPKS